MRNMLVILMLSSSIFMVGCGEDPAGPSEMGTLTVRITDAPGDFEEANISFSEVSVNFAGEWIILNDQPQTLDLLTLTNGKTALLGESELEPGKYTQIRLKISAAEVVADGRTFSMTVPSGAQSGLKFGPAFDIEAGIGSTLIVDFDAHRSIRATGPPGNPNNFILRPVIRVILEATTGAISGQISNPQNAPMAYAIVGNDTITATLADPANGNFLLGFLDAGSYTVAIVDTLGQSHSVSGVAVTVGSTTALGAVTLQ